MRATGGCLRAATPWYYARMKTKQLAAILERVETWPAHAQDELAEIVRDMDAGLKNETYEPTPEELEGIDRSLRDAAAGKFATEEEVEAVFAKFRRK
jgi:hypothetical protein